MPLHAKLTDLPDWTAVTSAGGVAATPNSFGWISPHYLLADAEDRMWVRKSAVVSGWNTLDGVLVFNHPTEEEALAIYVPKEDYSVLQYNRLTEDDGSVIRVAQTMRAAPRFTRPGGGTPIGDPDFDLHLTCNGRHPSRFGIYTCEGLLM